MALHILDVQQVIETAIGGTPITHTVEGRKRFAVQLRYPRELRNDPSMLKKIYVHTPLGTQVPLGELVNIEYTQGPQMIKSENTFLVSHVLWDIKKGYDEIGVIQEIKKTIQERNRHR